MAVGDRNDPYRGYNYRIDEPRAALATARLRRLDAENARRHQLDVRYRELLAEVDGVTPTLAPPATEGDVPAHHLFTVTLDDAHGRDAIRAALAGAGIQTSLHYPPAHRFSIYADHAPELPATDDYGARAMTLPMFAGMTEQQQDLVVGALADALNGR